MGSQVQCRKAEMGMSHDKGQAHARLILQVFSAFDHACDLVDLEIAGDLLCVAERSVAMRAELLDGYGHPFTNRLIDAHFRLLELRLED